MSDSGEQSNDEVPWTTTEDYIRGAAEHLDLDPDGDTIGKAVEWGNEHEEISTRKPSTIAAGALYFSGLITNNKRTKEQVSAAVGGVNHNTMATVWRELASTAGWDVPERGDAEITIKKESEYTDIEILKQSLRTRTFWIRTAGWTVALLGSAITIALTSPTLTVAFVTGLGVALLTPLVMDLLGVPSTDEEVKA